MAIARKKRRTSIRDHAAVRGLYLPEHIDFPKHMTPDECRESINIKADFLEEGTDISWDQAMATVILKDV